MFLSNLVVDIHEGLVISLDEDGWYDLSLHQGISVVKKNFPACIGIIELTDNNRIQEKPEPSPRKEHRFGKVNSL